MKFPTWPLLNPPQFHKASTRLFRNKYPHSANGGSRLHTEARSLIFAEGFAELLLDQWIGAFLPTGAPEPIAERPNVAVNAALRDESVRKGLTVQAQEPVGGTAEAYAGFVHEEWEKFGRLVKGTRHNRRVSVAVGQSRPFGTAR